MYRQITAAALLAAMLLPAVSDEPSADKLPRGIEQFNGMLVGRLAAKDIETGTFTVQVDAVPRVWQNSKADDPKSIVGKTVEVSGVFGKFLDVLVVTRAGETVEFECKHDGERLVFPGELLRKVAPYDPADYPVLPEAFRGFRGVVNAEVVKKDPETFELIIKINRVIETWKESEAKDPRSIEGKSLMLAGFWNRRDAYHDLKVGDRIDVGMRHIGLRSDHMTVAESVRKSQDRSTSQNAADKDARMRESAGGESDAMGRERRGFRGMLVGKLVEKDIERGTFTVIVEAIPRVWNNNQATNPKSFLGKQVSAQGVHGKMIDVLVVTKTGDTIEFGARHDEGSDMQVMEVLRKVAPVKPGDYPVLPDAFRGFRGMIVAKVMRKDDHLMDVVIEVSEIKETFPASKAKDASAMIGKQAMLAGFWNRKEAFYSLNVGDVIECGVEHPQLLSDHLSVIESVKKVRNR